MPGSVPVPVAPAAQNELQLHAQRQRHWQTMWQLPAASVLANPRNPAPPAEPVPPAKGQIIVLTGDGIGKSNTAFGMGMAMLAQNRPLAVVQFLPTPADSPVRRFLGFNPLCSFTTFGQEATWQAQDRTRDTDLTRHAWAFAKEKIQQPDLGMIILDDINMVLHHGYLGIDPVLRQLRQRNRALTVVLTGCHAPFELIDMANVCIEMRDAKLPGKPRSPGRAALRA